MRTLRLLVLLSLIAILALPATSALEPLVLTGELRAREAEYFTVPLGSSWRMQLKWLIEEGSQVSVGDVVARLDPGDSQDRLDEARDELARKLEERLLHETESRLEHLNLELNLARAEAEYEKARIDASVPEGILGGKDLGERRIERQKKQNELEGARLALIAAEAQTTATAFADDLEVADIEDRIRRFEEALVSLELRATRAGIVVHEEHPWQGRKFRVGDQVQAGFLLASVPNISTLEVRAWAMEPEIPRLRVGQRARLVLEAFPGAGVGGEIVAIGASGQRRLQWGKAPWFPLTIRLDEIDAALMKPGMSVRCEIDSEVGTGGGP